MKLSVAMMLGDSLRIRNEMTTLSEGDRGYCGCAIGAGVLAVGGTHSVDYHTLFPWLLEPFFDNGQGIMRNYWGAISRRFIQVMHGGMTYEQLADWVRSVEPECGECNKFVCTCAKPVSAAAEEDKVDAI